MKKNKPIHKLTFREKLIRCKKEGNRIYKGIGIPFDCKLQAEICSGKNCPIGKEEK